ncbi:MAG: hypothetical protein FRX49_08549 [Trebouxia sp. A1-2]|nr:MAG: hypothetical protein FRX49_08549 [Trebouxia sp. A1-2]
MHLRPLQVSFDPAFNPFSSLGTRKASARCACSASVGLAPPVTEESKALTHIVADSIRGLLPVGTVQAAETTLGQRTQANNILPGRSQLREVSQSSDQHAQARVPGKSGPGRPKGKPAWNKGRSMSASAKQQISKSQKNRWQQQPVLRGLVSSKLKGKEPWNKGQKLNQGICDKMSAAKQGHTVPRSVCAKMSRSHTGLRPSQASRAAMSQAASGVAKRAEHKAKIAAAQRRRHAAARALTAVEAFHRGLDSASLAGPQSPNRSSPGKGKGRRSSVRCLSGRSSQGKSLTKTQIMTAYKAELREYRSLQEELGPWTQAFKAQHGRKPGLLDVERTGIAWLLDKFKAYVILRDRLLSDTSILRDKLEVAAPEVARGQSNENASTSRPSGMKAASYAIKMNANAGSAKRSQAQSAATFTAALEYRRQQQALAETAAVSVAAAAAALEAAATAALVEAAGETASTLGDDMAVVSVASDISTGEGLEQDTYTQTRPQHASVTPHGSCLAPAVHNRTQHAQHVVQTVDPRADSARSSLAMPQQNGASLPAVQQNGNASRNGNDTAAIRTKHASGNGRPSLIGSQARPDGVGGPSQQDNSGRCAAHNAQASGAAADASQQDKSDTFAADGAEASVATAASQPDPLVNSNGSQAQESLPQHSGLSVRAAEAETVPAGIAQTGATSSPSSLADDAMAAAIASIQLRKIEGVPPVPTGAKAIPAPSLNSSPRIKSALLAAQEYRKLKAAKTAALAVAAATAAAAAAKSKSQNHFGNQ